MHGDDLLITHQLLDHSFFLLAVPERTQISQNLAINRGSVQRYPICYSRKGASPVIKMSVLSMEIQLLLILAQEGVIPDFFKGYTALWLGHQYSLDQILGFFRDVVGHDILGFCNVAKQMLQMTVVARVVEGRRACQENE